MIEVSGRIDIFVTLPMQGYFYAGEAVVPIIVIPPEQTYQYHLRALGRIITSLEILFSLSIPISIVGPVDPIDLTLQNDLTGIVTLEIGIKNVIRDKDDVLLSVGVRNHLTEDLSYTDQYYFDKGHGLTE